MIHTRVVQMDGADPGSLDRLCNVGIDVFELRSNENVDIDVANVNNNDESVQCGIDILGNKGVVDISSTGVSSSNSGIKSFMHFEVSAAKVSTR